MKHPLVVTLLLLMSLVANLAAVGGVSVAMVLAEPESALTTADAPCHQQTAAPDAGDLDCHHDCLDCLFGHLIDGTDLTPAVELAARLPVLWQPVAFIPHHPDPASPPPTFRSA